MSNTGLRAVAPYNLPVSEDRRRRVERGLVPSPESRPSPISDDLVQERMALYATPGMSVALIDGGRVDWVAHYGVACGDGASPVTDQTLFQCCSISKAVATLVALRCIEKGLFDLDSEVNEFLLEWKLRDTSGNLAGASVRQVLSHTAGINVHGAPGYPCGATIPTLDQILEGAPPAITAPVRVTSEPGLYRYSCGGFCTLQKLIETVTHRAFTSVAQEFVLDPLGMQNSTFEQPLGHDHFHRAASAHLTLSGMPCSEHWFVYPEQAVGGLWTTASDLCLVVIEIQRALKGSGTILSTGQAREMLSSHARDYNVGLGIYVSNWDQDSAFFSHLGAHLGWQAVLMGYLQLGKGAVILTNNGYTGSELYGEVLRSMAKEYEWPNFNGSFR